MPTTPGTLSETLDPKAAQAKFLGLITESSDTETPEPVVEAVAEPEKTPEPSAPAPQSAETDSEPTDEKMYEVKVDGEPILVDEDELKSGYSRDRDYRQKTMALADERKAFESERSGVTEEREQYRAGLAQIRQALQDLQGEPDWTALRKELPAAEFLERKADWEHQQLNLQRLKAAEDEIAAKARTDQEKQTQVQARAEWDKLMSVLPEWGKPEIYKAELTKIVAGARQYGFTEQDLQSVTDHRAILLLRDALKYRELKREPTPAVKAKVSGIKTARPGTPERPRPNAKQEQLIEATKSGRQRDAMSAILGMLPDD